MICGIRPYIESLGSNAIGLFRATFLILIIALSTSSARAQFWERLPGPPVVEIHTLTADSAGGVYVYSERRGLFKSTNDGIEWSRLTVDGPCATAPDGTLYCADTARLARSTDRGTTWTYGGIIDAASSAPYVNSIAVDRSGTIYLATKENGLYVSSNQGDTWRNPLVENTRIATGTIGSGYSERVWAGTGRGAYWSSDNGLSWNPAGEGLPLEYIYEIYAPSPDTLLVATSDQGVYRSTDRGLTWSPLPSSPAGDATVNAIRRDSKGNYWAAAQQSGVYISTDDGVTWKDSSDGIATEFGQIHSIKLLALPTGRVFVATRFGALYRNRAVSVGVTAFEPGAGDAAIKIDSPFEVALTVSKSEPTTVILFDFLGRSFTLYDESAPTSGRHMLRLPSSLAMGAYMLELRQGRAEPRIIKFLLSY